MKVKSEPVDNMSDFSLIETVIYFTLAKQDVNVIENFVVFGQFKIKLPNY